MKDASHKTKLTLGIFVISSVLLAAGLILFVGRDIPFLRGYVVFYTHFNSIEGLSKGAPIQLGGVDIGHVGTVDIDNVDNTSKIKVQLLIMRPNHKLIKQDSVVSIRTQGVLGDKFLSLSPGTPISKSAAGGDLLPSREGDGFAGIMNRSIEVFENLENISKILSDALKDLKQSGKMKRIMDSVDEATTSIKTTTTRLGSKDSMLTYMSEKKAQSALKDTLENVREASDHLATSLRKINEGKGTLGALINDSTVYDDLKSLLGGANRNKTLKYFIQKAVDSSKEKEQEEK